MSTAVRLAALDDLPPAGRRSWRCRRTESSRRRLPCTGTAPNSAVSSERFVMSSFGSEQVGQELGDQGGHLERNGSEDRHGDYPRLPEAPIRPYPGEYDGKDQQ